VCAADQGKDGVVEAALVAMWRASTGVVMDRGGGGVSRGTDRVATLGSRMIELAEGGACRQRLKQNHLRNEGFVF
jgi:hypothetical protein